MLPSFRVLLSRPIRLTGALLLAGAVLAVPSLAAGLDVTIVGHPALDTTSTSASFTWSRTGTVSRTQCKLDDAAYANCGASKSYSGLTEGTHTFSVRVEGGGDTAVDTFTWQIDRTAPSVPSVSGGSLTWVKTSVVLSASGATDPGGSGVKSHQHRTSADGGATWSTAATGTPFSVTTAGESITQFRAVDRAGNVSAWAPAVAGVDNTARVDKASPVVPVLTGSSTAWQNVGSATITGGGSTDVLSGFDHYQCRTSADKGVTWSAAVDGDTFSASSEGETQVQMRSVDAAGNVSAWVLGYLRIDRTAPTAPTVTGGGTNWLGMDTATITASASTDAPGSGVEHYESQTSTDAGVTWSTVVTGKSLVVGGEGETQVRMRAVDRFGHVSGWSQTSVKLDTANPTVPTVSGGSSTWRNIASVVVSASGATDSPGSGLLGYQVRKSTNGGATWGFPMNGSAITITAAGETLLQFRSTDNSGRHSAWAPASPTSGSRVRIDRTAPSAPTVSNSSSSWRDVASVTVDASGSSDGSGYVAGLSGYEFQVSTDGGSSWTAAVAGSSYTISAEGQTLVRYSALDNAGNRSGWTTATVRIDRTDPTAPTSVSGGSLSWRNWSSVTVSPSGATDSPGSGVAGYQYRTSTDGGLTWSAAQSGTAQISAEGERVVQIRSVDAYGHVSGWFPSTPVAAGTVRLDRTAPAAPSVSGGSSTWQNIASLTVSASGGSDALSGFVGLEYQTSTNGGSSWTSSTSGTSVTISSEGQTLVRYRSLDVAGNRSAWVPGWFPNAAGTVRIDRNAPSAPTLTSTGSSWRTSSSVTVTASAADAGSGASLYEQQTSSDGGSTWSAVATGSSLVVSGQGETLVRFRATDAMGYVSGWTQGTVRIDSVAPSSPVVSGGSLACAASRTISGSGGSDATSGFSGYEHRTSTNGGTTWGAAVAGSSLTLTVTGSYLVQFRSLDVAGNTSAWAPSSAGAANTACIS